MSPGSSTESYPAFAHIGLRENPGKNLNQMTCPDRESNPGHLVSRTDALTVTPQVCNKRSSHKIMYDTRAVSSRTGFPFKPRAICAQGMRHFYTPFCPKRDKGACVRWSPHIPCPMLNESFRNIILSSEQKILDLALYPQKVKDFAGIVVNRPEIHSRNDQHHKDRPIALQLKSCAA
ncbi:hypothetical protein ANN_25396 [Periplaneta americana]|uniref:Uncharacterized protein n=1 Tax=Periplaneta americana TaxID=6978 RepID=A0ABQ8S1D3_PERAM|nr:hypothetical protein ANN_25396 [Periplaneta americana]